MSAQAQRNSEFDPTVAEMLACPVCHGDLRVEGERLVCGGCELNYKVVDGIPALIAKRAEHQT
jgi:uncharacterized protein YbaR (Trm112 family)